MTKEEYERLLNSDYWKGYSYSLIKERNFTCEDCGRNFYNERNKLQVHHLVYRDVKQWSYKPEELLVLCEACHKKRHGIPLDSFDKANDYSSNVNGSNPFNSSCPFGDDSNPFVKKTSRTNRYYVKRERRFKVRYLLYALLLFFLMLLFFSRKNSINEKETNDFVEFSFEEDGDDKLESKSKEYSKFYKKNEQRQDKETENESVEEENEEENKEKLCIESFSESVKTNDGSNASAKKDDVNDGHSTLELLERKNHADVVKRAQRAGVSTEGSTIEILERINHADVVKRAQRAGVSTEGSTIEILERINHADVVKRAQRAGVSTEGSTIEILERINHADVVKRAQKAGVSTEGSTIEILERINRKNLEKYNW